MSKVCRNFYILGLYIITQKENGNITITSINII